ncbi:hypothetical protein [Bacillus sp. NPDC094106]|uniref:hypothetical protein n=1 Tax=Bacillus sp. NPDC094106 TaxID=3363949 RepID=UPI00381F5EAF
MSNQNSNFKKEMNEIIAPFSDEVRASLLMHSLTGVFVQDGIDDIEKAREYLIQEFIDMVDSLTYTNLISLYTVGIQLKKDYESTKARESNRFDKRPKHEKKKVMKELKTELLQEEFERGYKQGEEIILNEIKKGIYRSEIQEIYNKGVEYGYQKSQKAQKAYQQGYERGISEKGGTVITSPMKLSRKDDYDKGYADGFEKGKSLRIEELKKMREF